MEVKKFEQIPPVMKKLLDEAGADIRVGDHFIDERGETIIRISKFSYNKKTQYREAHVTVHYDHATDWEGTRFSSYGSEEVEGFLKRYTKLTKSIAEHRKEAMDVINGKTSIDEYRDQSTDNISDNNQLISKNSKEGLLALQSGLEEKKSRALLVAKFVSHEMERRRQELNRIREQMYGVVAEFKKKVERIMRVITTIELYLGIDEEIFQIQSGEAAPMDTPITFRQQVLYMDEEMGHWKHGGRDFRDIAKFDNWLLQPAKFRNGVLNYEVFLPEEKGMIVFRPRRYDKEYGDPVFNAVYNEANRATYLFIRNGQNLYRIYTEKITIYPRLFPQRTELMDLLKEAEKAYSDYSSEKAKEKVEDLTYQYRKRAVLMQGLIDRTELFNPLKERVNIFNMEATPGAVNFVYDDEATLPSGRLPFDDWWQKINAKIEKGSRILLTGEYTYGYHSKYDTPWADRFYLAKSSYDGLKSVPDLPKEGVYEVEEFFPTESFKLRESEIEQRRKDLEKKGYKIKMSIKKDSTWRVADEKTGSKVVHIMTAINSKPDLTIMYMPEAEASAGWNRWDTHERKNRTRFKILREDSFVMNYDQISIEEVEFYLTSRVDRHNYLSMMPVLESIHSHLKEEAKQEEEFIKFVAQRNTPLDSPEQLPAMTERVRESVRWWKFKNQWKRSINKDDALALRMIEKRITSPNYETFDHY